MKENRLHKDNQHAGRYNFQELTKALPELEKFLVSNPKGDNTIVFSDPDAVLALNKALLKYYYNITYWDIPKGFLCPPIPGRADYIYYASDLLQEKKGARVLDIGTGANCIYPIIGSQLFDWKFTATDINPESIKNAKKIVSSNDVLTDKIKVVEQSNKSYIFNGIINKGDYYDLTVCNPPFHASKNEAIESNRRKVTNLNKHKKSPDKNLNFGGQKDELWCPGGEIFFLKKMIKESAQYRDQVTWFTTLVSKNEHIRPLRYHIRKAGASKVKVKEMSQGNKISRMIAWSYKE